MPTAQPRDAALATAAADSRALRAALGEAGSWRAQAEALARGLVAATLDSRGTLLEVQRAFAIFPPGSPAGDSLFRLAEALQRGERDARARPARRFSFDMLGEGARTAADAERNFRRYMEAIRAMER